MHIQVCMFSLCVFVCVYVWGSGCVCVLSLTGKLSSVHLSFDDPAYFGPLFSEVGRDNHTYDKWQSTKCVRACVRAPP